MNLLSSAKKGEKHSSDTATPSSSLFLEKENAVLFHTEGVAGALYKLNAQEWNLSFILDQDMGQADFWPTGNNNYNRIFTCLRSCSDQSQGCQSSVMFRYLKYLQYHSGFFKQLALSNIWNCPTELNYGSIFSHQILVQQSPSRLILWQQFSFRWLIIGSAWILPGLNCYWLVRGNGVEGCISTACIWMGQIFWQLILLENLGSLWALIITHPCIFSITASSASYSTKDTSNFLSKAYIEVLSYKTL